MALENQKPDNSIDNVNQAEEVGQSLYEDFEPNHTSFSDSQSNGDDSTSEFDQIPDEIESSLNPETVEDISEDSQSILKASENPLELAKTLNSAMDSLGLKYEVPQNGTELKTLTHERSAGDLVRTQINNSGVGQVEIDGKTLPIDLSSADKVFQSTRESQESNSANIEVASVNGDGSNFTNLSLMANSTQRIELPNGDVLHRPPKNAAGVKWIKDVKGTDENGNDPYSVLAYDDGRSEIRYSQPRPDGIRQVNFDSQGKVSSVERVESVEQEQSTDSGSESGPPFESFQTSSGAVKQEFDYKSGQVVTEFPEGFGVNSETQEFDSELPPELENVQSITYNPQSKDEPYSIQMREGKGTPEQKAKLLEKLKNDQISIPLSFHPEGETNQSINFFAGKFNSSDPVDRQSGQINLKPDGSLEYSHGENTEGLLKTIKYPPNDPQRRLDKTVYDQDVTSNLPDGHPNKNLESTLNYRDEDGKPQELRKTKTEESSSESGEDKLDSTDESERPKESDEKFELTGRQEDFEHGGEKGTLYTNEKNGYVNGIKFSEGNRAGQEYQFEHDEAGNLLGMKVKVPQENGDPKEITLKRDGDNWKIEPKDAKIPGFESVQVDDQGVITGDIKVKENGDIVYDAKDGQIEAMRINGTHDKFNLDDYHRQRTTADGKSKSEYWDGYEWREGELQRNENGTSTVTFKGKGKVSKIIRDATKQGDSKNDGVVVVRSDGTVFNANWKGNQMSRTKGDKTVNLYNSGVVDSNGKKVWMEGQRRADGVVQFSTSDQRAEAQIKSGLLPAFAKHHPNGDVTAEYRDQRQVRTDKNGRVNLVDYPNGQHVEMERDAYGRVMKVKGVDGKSLVRDEHLEADQSGNQLTRWKVEGGDADETYDGRLEVGQDNTIKLIGADNQSTTIEGNGRTVKRSGEDVTSVITPTGQKWLRESREGEEVSGNEPWTVVSRDGKQHTFSEGGKIALLENGRVGVKYSDGKMESVDDRGTFSTFNKEGVEISAVNADGSHILRDDQGYLKEIKSRVDSNAADSDPAKRQFDVRTFVHKDGKLVGVNLNGKPSEVFVDGRFRELKNNKDFSDTSAENLGSYVDYRPADGLRTVRKSEDQNSSERTEYELSGSHFSYDSAGKMIEGRKVDHQTGLVTEVENGRIASVHSPESGIKRSFKYGENSGNLPTEVYQSTGSGEDVLIARLAKPEDNAPADTPYEVFPNGNTESANGKKVFGRVSQTTGAIQYFNQDPVTGDYVGVWGEDIKGRSVLVEQGSLSMVKENGQIQRAYEPNGTPRQFVYDGDVLQQVVRPGDPPLITDKVVDGQLMAVDPRNPEKFLGKSSYDAKTGAYRIDFQTEDGTGAVSHSLERYPDGSVARYDSQGKRTSHELPGKWKDSYENGLRTKRTFENGNVQEFGKNGAKILERVKGQYSDHFENGERVKRQFDNGASITFDQNTGRVRSSIDSNGIERKFTYRDDAGDNSYKPEGDPPDKEYQNKANHDIMMVEAKDTNVEGAKFEKVEEIGADGLLHPVEEGSSNQTVIYNWGDGPGAGTRDVVHSFVRGANGQPGYGRATRYEMDGDKLKQENGEGFKLVEFGAEQERNATSGAHVDSIEAIENVNALIAMQNRDYQSIGDIPEEVKGTYQQESEVTLEHQTKALFAHAENLPAKEKARLVRDLETFQNRARDIGLSNEEVANTLYYANKLMEAETPKSPLTKPDLVRASLALMHGAASPEISNHGVHKTCGSTTSRESILSTNPSLAGQIASNAMLDGEIIIGENGKVKAPGQENGENDTRVVLDLASMKADNEAVLSAASTMKSDTTGYRDQLGQVLDHALINFAHINSWNKNNPDKQIEEAVYTQTKPVDSNDTGERLNIPGQEELQDASMSFKMLADLNRTLLGQERLAINGTVEKGSEIDSQFTSSNEMVTTLNSGLENGPMTLLVNATHPAFKEGESGGDDWDLVNVSQAEVVDGKQYFKISGFHGAKSDKWISASDLYNATLESSEHNGRELDDYDVDKLAYYNSNRSMDENIIDDLDVSQFDTAETMLASVDTSNLQLGDPALSKLNEIESLFEKMESATLMLESESRMLMA